MFWKKKAAKPTKRAQVVDEAQQIIATKRTEIGKETLDQIKSAIMNRETSALERAKKTIIQADQDKVRDNINFWLRE